MRHDIGTPVTLTQAIENGLEEFRRVGRQGTESYFIRLHVKDFLAQHFVCVGTDETVDAVMKIFKRVTEE